jgi:hypothetical protein
MTPTGPRDFGDALGVAGSSGWRIGDTQRDPGARTGRPRRDILGTLIPRQEEGVTNPRTGEQLYPGLPRGSELGWGPAGGQFLINRPVSEGSGVSSYDFFRFTVFKIPSPYFWDYTTLNFDSDVTLVDKNFASVFNFY